MEREVPERAADPVGRALAVFEVFDELLSEPDYRGCPFVNAAAEYPHHEGIRGVIAHHRAWLPDLFARLLDPLDPPRGLITALVQLTDGAITTAHLDRTGSAALTARATAELLLAHRS